MSVGAKSEIDIKLVQIYADKVTNNVENITRIDPEQIWQSMSAVARTNIVLMRMHKPEVACRS